MPDPKDQLPNPDDGGKVDLSQYVPKDELAKLSSEKDASIGELKKALDEAKLQLLDPDYLAYRQSKSDAKPKAKPKGDANLPDDVSETIESQGKQITQLQLALQQVAAMLELAEVEKRNPDFNEYREPVQKLLESQQGANLTIEQAYLIVKEKNPKKGDDKPNPETGLKGSEKPTGAVPAGDLKRKTFKSEDDAANAAWEEVKQRHGLSGDII